MSDNLRVPTSEEARKNGRLGGIASGEARRKKKAMKETLQALLSLALKEGDVVDIDSLQSLPALNGKNLTVQDAILLKQVKKALKGDLKAAEFVRDSSGNKCKENFEGTVDVSLFESIAKAAADGVE